MWTPVALSCRKSLFPAEGKNQKKRRGGIGKKSLKKEKYLREGEGNFIPRKGFCHGDYRSNGGGEGENALSAKKGHTTHHIFRGGKIICSVGGKG